MKFRPTFSKFKLWNGFPLFSVFGGLYLNLLKSSLTDFFQKSLFCTEDKIHSHIHSKPFIVCGAAELFNVF